MIYNAEYTGSDKDILPLQTKVQFASSTRNRFSQDCTIAVYTNHNSTLSCHFCDVQQQEHCSPLLLPHLPPKYCQPRQQPNSSRSWSRPWQCAKAGLKTHAVYRLLTLKIQRNVFLFPITRKVECGTF
jgi:hypothetical protein